jgi:hypothetical protein
MQEKINKKIFSDQDIRNTAKESDAWWTVIFTDPLAFKLTGHRILSLLFHFSWAYWQRSVFL